MAQDDEYPAGVSDARLAACQQDVLKMVELAAQVAEGLAANVDPEAEGAPEANTIKEDAAMFLRLADGVQETMAQSRWPVEHAYARSAENLLLRRRLDEMVEEAQDELGHALRTHLAAALRDNCRATLVGGTTYGKGVIQGVFGLSDGGALIETVASYATPARTEINLKGVTPDEKKTFVSDVLGAGFADADIKSASIQKPRACVAPTPPGKPVKPGSL